MTLALRRAAPDDYDVIQVDEIVGRIYRMNADGELWRWTDQVMGSNTRAAGWPIASTRPRRRSGRRGERPPSDAGADVYARVEPSSSSDPDIRPSTRTGLWAFPEAED
jgi:hypothetical protein